MAERVCPVWVGYFLVNPLRRLFQKPEKLLAEHIRPGMTVLDVGCAMGFFTLPMARMVGPDGMVIAVDLQPGMIKSLKRRITRAGLSDRIDTRICSENSLGIDDLNGAVDFAIAFYVMHEIPDVPRVMREIYAVLKPGSGLYILEPKGHATPENFAATEQAAINTGFKFVDRPLFKRDRAVMLVKN